MCRNLLLVIIFVAFGRAQDYQWAEWTPWSACDKPCDYGIKRRHRGCISSSGIICSETDVEQCTTGLVCSQMDPQDLDLEDGFEPDWLQWESWSTCTATCGGGMRKRVRRCPPTSEITCLSTASERCNMHSCTLGRGTLSWEPWSTCTASCGGGSRTRIKRCPDRSCMERESESCNQVLCGPMNPEANWSPWGSWRPCSTQCGRGTRTRNRYCMGLGSCIGDIREIQSCYESAGCTPIPTETLQPTFSDWTDWSKCSKTCGKGQETRSRVCFGGRNQCSGETIETRECRRRRCVKPVWSSWTTWSICSVTCGEGNQRRQRKCSEGGGACTGRASQTRTCQITLCKKDPEWSKWSDWKICSKTCDRGIIERSRTCIMNENHDLKCKGKSKETEPCFIKKCPKVASWNEWGLWTECSVTCGEGERERTRTCDRGDSETCKGIAKQTENCKSNDCVPEHWSSWNSWTKCYPSQPCGSPGWKVRTRSCVGGKAGVGNCKGVQKGYQKCTNECLPEWNDWVAWNKCSASCGDGVRSRERTCKVSGKCVGKSLESQDCNVKKCKFEWENWEKWSKCSKSCGEGTQQRKRKCGAEEGCKGPSSQTNICNPKNCTLGGWNNWISWTECTSSCGLGTRERIRTCAGSDCKGPSTDSEKCIGHKCDTPTGRTPETKSGKCEEMLGIANGEYSTEKKGKITIIKYKCHSGFTLKGPDQILCDTEGNWSGRPPFCIANVCIRIPTIIEEGRTCWKSCTRKSECKGISTDCICDDVCGKSCFDPESVLCDLPEKPENGNVQFDSRNYGHYCQYSCEQGYVMSGPTRRRCRSDGKWSEKDPKCLKFDTCGQPGDIGGIFNVGIIGARVLAGTSAKIGAWPWQAMITVNAENDVRQSLQTLKGGGSIINDQWILTAAHIFEPTVLKSRPNARGYLVILGITSIDTTFNLPDDVQIFEPELLIIHPKYRHKRNNFDYDVSLIKVGKQFKVVEKKLMFSTLLPHGQIIFSSHIRSVCLPCVRRGLRPFDEDVRKSFNNDVCKRNAESLKDSEKVVVTGFGRVGERSQRPRILQQGLLKIADNKICENAVEKIKVQWPQSVFSSRMLCTLSGRTTATVDACTGDSGGPLVRKLTTEDGTDYWIQEGIVSWGFGCGRFDDEGRPYPGYFTKLSSVMPFITKTVKENSP